MHANDSTTTPERFSVCPDLSRVAHAGSGRFKRNIHGLVPTVPSCPDRKTARSWWSGWKQLGNGQAWTVADLAFTRQTPWRRDVYTQTRGTSRRLAASKTGMRALTTLIVALASGIASAQAPVASQAKEAVPEIVRLFDQHRIVMLGEIHGSIQFDQLLKQLANSPAFAERVNDIVVEMGNAVHQAVLDRYINGDDVPTERLAAVWQDAVGTPGGIAAEPYHGLFTAVREINRKLPPERKLRVLAGDPPIDWGQVQTREDIAPFLPFRDEHYASVVRYEVLAKRRKALLVMGAGHFLRRDAKPGLVEQQMISAFVKPYVIIVGSDVVHGFDEVDRRFTAADGPHAPWIVEMKGTWVGALPRWTDASLIGYPARGSNGTQSGTWEQAADAYLFLGARDTLTAGGGPAFDLEGTAYGNELRRRWKIMLPNPPAALPKHDGSTLPLLRRAPPSPPALPPNPVPR